jgi:type I restriction enzyme R subunit
LEEENFWTNLTADKMEFLKAVVKPLLRTVSDADFKAMRFEKDIVEVSLAHLTDEPAKYETLKESIIEEIGELPLSINMVAREQELIRQAQTNHFWATITEEKFDLLIERLAPLMKFRDTVTPWAPARFNLKDLLAEKGFVEFGPQHEALSVAKYRELVEKKINDLVLSSPILQKLKQGKDITPEEAEQLAEELHNEHPHITIDLLRKVYNHRKAALVQFIRHILGIEPLESFAETVTQAFDDFISRHSYLTSRQLQFLDLLKNFVLEKGDVSKRNLIESPFTLLHPEGIRGVFNQREIDEILRLTEKVLAA